MCYVPELVLYHYPSPRHDLMRRRINLVRNAGGDLVSEIARTDALIRPYARDGIAMLLAP
jgi:hypothetical protein